MQCTLLIPHLLWREALRGEGGAELDRALPALRRILFRAERQRFPAVSLEAWLCQAFEVERNLDWPVAPLTLALDGAEPGDAYWLRADPVHVRAQRDELHLADATIAAPRRDESDALVAALNDHFGRDGLVFLAPHPARWYLRLPQPARLLTHTLSEAAGRNVAPLMPEGEDALEWRRIGNEVQMLLHEHPVNAAREARGELPLNSIWIWGGGVTPAVPGRHFGVVWSGNALAQALAAAADVGFQPAPQEAGEWLAHAESSGQRAHLLVLDALAAPARYGDLAAWGDRVTALERSWFAPLEAAVRARRLTALTIVSPGRFACERFDFARGHRWRIWRQPRSLSLLSAPLP